MTKRCVYVLALLLLCAVTGWADSITVTNYSFELPGAGKIKGWDAADGAYYTADSSSAEVPGWESTGTVSDSGLETNSSATDGSYVGFLMAGDPSVYQLTDHTIVAGEVYTLSVDAAVTYMGTSFKMSLYYDNSGTRVTLGTVTKTITSTWTTYTLTAKANDVTASIGNKLGIEMQCVDSDAYGWMGMDNVQLEVAYVDAVTPTDGATKVSIDEDLTWAVASGWTVDLYFGSNEPNLITTTYKKLSKSSSLTYEQGTMAYLTTYYWRVDAYEPNTVSPYTPILHEGPVWSFTTQPQAPEITVDPENTTVASGTDAVFTVTAVSTTTYTWYKEGVSTALTTGTDYTVSGNTLTVLNVGVGDEGYYYCVASNSLVSDTAESGHAQLLTQRLIGWWKMDGNLNDSVTSGTAHAGSMDDPNYEVGADGQALVLDGSEYATVSNTETLFNFHSQGMTVSAWVKTTESGYGGVVSKADRDNSQLGWTLQHNGDTIYMVFRSVEEVAYSNGQASVDAGLTDGEWHLLAGTFDPETRMVHMYASYVEDGINKLGYNESGPFEVLTSTEDLPLMIGTETNADDSDPVTFIGDIDDVRLYTYALSDTEVAEELFYPVTSEKVCVLSQFTDQTSFDFNGDCEVNLEDFAEFAGQWLQTAFYPAD